jgi:hypothetical protein
MISDEHLREFGFDNIEKFPELLTNHEVTVSLPSAIVHGVAPITITITRGLAIPMQMPGIQNGMIITENGTMVYVSHRDPKDFSTPLEASFTDDIAFDIRIEAFNIMRRAVEVDPNLKEVWEQIQKNWVAWYPPQNKEIDVQSAGAYRHIQEAYDGLQRLMQRFIFEVQQRSERARGISLKVVVQTQEEFDQGWQGEEFVVDEIIVGSYQPEDLKSDLKKMLKNPVFPSQSTFQVNYEPRAIPVIKLLVIPMAEAGADAFSHGIDLA